MGVDDNPTQGSRIRHAPRIGVMGPRSCSEAASDLAEAVGRHIAAAGAVLICGGGAGVMEAASRGAAEAGGLVVGILPSEDPESANPYVSLPIVTGLGNARNVINVLTSHVVIAIAGGPGTLSEIALSAKVGTPVVGLNSWSCTIEGKTPPGFEVHMAEDAAGAVSSALRLARGRLAGSRF